MGHKSRYLIIRRAQHVDLSVKSTEMLCFRIACQQIHYKEESHQSSRRVFYIRLLILVQCDLSRLFGDISFFLCNSFWTCRSGNTILCRRILSQENFQWGVWSQDLCKIHLPSYNIEMRFDKVIISQFDLLHSMLHINSWWECWHFLIWQQKSSL